MSGLQAIALLLAAGGATATVLARDVLRQAIVSGIFGLTLVLAFLLLQAPDVSLSALVVSTFALPLIILVALAQVRRRERE